MEPDQRILCQVSLAWILKQKIANAVPNQPIRHLYSLAKNVTILTASVL